MLDSMLTDLRFVTAMVVFFDLEQGTPSSSKSPMSFTRQEVQVFPRFEYNSPMFKSRSLLNLD